MAETERTGKRFVVKDKNERGEHWIQYFAANGEQVIPAEGYRNQSGALNLIRLLKECADARIFDEYGKEIFLDVPKSVPEGKIKEIVKWILIEYGTPLGNEFNDTFPTDSKIGQNFDKICSLVENKVLELLKSE